ncbi:bifunctional farnesyl-diphosphate farnesyltransferase/squalene synthase [Varicellaria rhodocarpa]|nr:bifunctional farnesyl-diphosphate farnesyltransferase/squalene synthase [Varicellaria rhodocarpa]
MGVKIGDVFYYLVHVQQLRAMIQWKTWHMPVHERKPENEAKSLQICFDLLDMTSRSFSGVIQELHPELLVPIALFYLNLRGLDTVEDDMTIALDEKVPILKGFFKIVDKEGWSYDGSGPDEKDRELLVKFYYVTEEFRKIKPEYREVITDITRQMGEGMAYYVTNAERGVDTVKDYELYCHIVAGLVGEGLTRLFVLSGLANKVLLNRPELQESMGQFLQKTNIIRDIREDFDDKRRFWPKAIWSKYVDNFEDLFKPENIIIAQNCSSEMVLNALSHADECLFYLAGLKEQSVFNFCAIPQAMAISTLTLVFRNPAIFKRNIKITKGEACENMIQSTQNHRLVCDLFRVYVRKIHKKNTPRDPNFLKISIACGKIEQFIESLYPSQDPKAIVRAQAGQPGPIDSAEKKAKEEAKWDTIYMFAFVMGTLFFLSCLMIGIAYLFGARFDVALSELSKGKLSRPDPAVADEIIKKYDHGEL